MSHVDMGGLVHMKRGWRLMGGRVNSMLWVLEEEEEKGGIWEKRRFSLAPHCEKKKKKTAHGFAA